MRSLDLTYLGGHHFSRDLQPLDKDGNPVSMWSKGDKGGDDDSSEEDSEEDSDEESEEEESDDDAKKPAADASREDRKAEKKARKEAAIRKAKGKNVQVGDMPSSSEEESEDEDDDMPANPNHSKAARKQAAKPQGMSDEEEDGDDDKPKPKKPVAQMSRKEREAFEAAQAKEKFMKLHLDGKTDEAKSDLARLQEVRERRAAEASRRQVSHLCYPSDLPSYNVLIITG